MCKKQRLYLNGETAKAPAPRQGTLEYLFKDYTEDKFQTELLDLGEAVGNEKW